MNAKLFAAFLVSALTFSLFAGCERERPSPAPEVASSAANSKDGDACAAQRALERLDARAPVPLLPHMANHQKQNMRDHLLAVQEIVLGLGSDDFAAIEQAGARLGSSPQMGQMCQHMGAGAPGFSERALAFHHTADGIARAARAQDRSGVMAALGATLRGCTSCHEAFQQRVVAESAFPHPPQ